MDGHERASEWVVRRKPLARDESRPLSGVFDAVAGSNPRSECDEKLVEVSLGEKVSHEARLFRSGSAHYPVYA